MSTKTSFKRIALVAVAALGFGMLSVVPSTAAVPQADTVTITPTTTTPYYVGGTYTATVAVSFSALATGDSMTTTMSMTSNVTTSTKFPVLSLETPTVTKTTANPAIDGAAFPTIMTTTESGTVASGAIKRVNGAYLVTFAPDVVGTYLIQVKNSGGTNNASAVWTVTVVAKPAITVATIAAPAAGTVVTKNYVSSAWPSWQKAVGKVTQGSPNTWSESDRDAALEITTAVTSPLTGRGTDDLTFACVATTTTATSGLAGCMNVRVIQSNGKSTPETGAMAAIDAVALTVSVDGPANASVNGIDGNFVAGVIPGKLYVEQTAQNTSLTKYVYVYSTGTPGVATVTIKAGTLVLETFTVNFYDKAQTITAVAANEVIPVTASADVVKTSATYQANFAYTSTASTGAITGKVVDSAGIPVPGLTIRTLSDTVANITNSYAATCVGGGFGNVTDATGTVKCDLVGAKEGKAKVLLTTLANATDATTLAAGGTSSPAVEFRVGGNPTQAKINFGDTTASYAAKTDFVPGEQGSFTIQLLDAKGLSVPNGTYTSFFSNAAGTLAQDLQSTYAFAAVALPATNSQWPFLYNSQSPVTTGAKVDGTGAVQRWLVNMPVNASDVELSVGGYIAGVAITKAVATVAPDKTVQAAADAAAEALDAALAATDAANAATDAADAATAAAQDAADAVAALAVTTQAQIASMRLQNIALSKKIIALTNLVNKLLKK
jgi:hypothetical protein